MDFSLQPDTPEISAFRQEVREWLAENMRGSEHLSWSGDMVDAGKRRGIPISPAAWRKS